MIIIVNADDFGKDETSTSAICEAFEAGVLSQTTAMVNMPWFEKGVVLSKEYGFWGNVGLHFNLTEGIPLAREMQECDFFCDNNGVFKPDFHLSLKNRLVMPAKLLPILKKEVTCQIERYLDAGYTMKHLDSHHHVHTDLSIAQVLLPIAKKYGFRTCRISRTVSSVSMGVCKKIYKFAINNYLAHYVPLLSGEMTDFADFKLLYKTLAASSTVEVMVHPGNAEEYNLMEQRTFWEEVASKGISLYHTA